MSFRGGRGDGRGRGRGRGGGGDRGGGRGGRGGRGGGFVRDEGPPAEIIEAGIVAHECESELICHWRVADKVPYFNAGVYLENKRKIGKVDEILGKISDVYFTVKMDPGILSKSFQPKDAVFIGTDKLLPLSRFTNPTSSSSGGRGGRSPGGRGGRSPGGRGGGGRGGRSPGGRGRGGRGGFASAMMGRSSGRGGGRSFRGGGGRGRY